ncbi:putative MFS family arabinose efflux permease [Trichococcus patagoniensis]|uniref:Putative MFS family arabinose efflux permease n=1 Tax=Trichococcus patagoniensis TaxID=382641 RepID=A0A2T5IIV8_9LACT|nr:MFS transporter [Trichococcus patagoniensis]PTQ83756.1 putative MFS family arabinose efflux permease [Trichococcus patagoniensis]
MKKTKLKVGILSMTLLNLSALVITSAFGAIMASFPGEPISKIQMIGTIPGLGSMLITLVVGVLAMRIPKKFLALIGILCVALGGLLPLAFHSTVNALLVCALIMGIGLGFIGTINPMLISMYFDGEERASLMGVGTAINSIGLMVMMIVGSTLGAQNWENTYLVFLLALLIFFVVMLFLPLDKVETQNGNAGHAHGPQGKPSLLSVFKDMNKYVLWVSLLAFAISFLYTIYPSNLSLVIAQKNFGGTAITGLVNALGTVGGLIAGFTISRINRVLKDKSIAIGFILIAVSYLLVCYAQNIVMIVLGAGLSGIAMAMIYSTIPFYVSIIAKPFQIAIAMSIFQFLNGLGGIISPIVLAGLGVASGPSAVLFGAICCFVIGFGLLVINFGKNALANRYEHQAVEADAVLDEAQA